MREIRWSGPGEEETRVWVSMMNAQWAAQERDSGCGGPERQVEVSCDSCEPGVWTQDAQGRGHIPCPSGQRQGVL